MAFAVSTKRSSCTLVFPLGRATEQPVLSADDKGADGTLGGVIVDRQVAVLDLAFLPAPVAGQIAIALLNAF